MSDVFLCFVTFLYGVLGQVWYLIVSIPDLCLPYFPLRVIIHHFGSLISPYAINVYISILLGARGICTCPNCSQFNHLFDIVKISHLHRVFVESKDVDESALMHLYQLQVQTFSK